MAITQESLALVAATGLGLSIRWQSLGMRALSTGPSDATGPGHQNWQRSQITAMRVLNRNPHFCLGEAVTRAFRSLPPAQVQETLLNRSGS